MELYYCQTCEKYTMEQKCTTCNKPTSIPRPPKYTPDDKYTKYRAEIKIEQRRLQGLYQKKE